MRNSLSAKRLLASGWTRLYLVVWVSLLGVLGYRYYQYEHILSIHDSLERELAEFDTVHASDRSALRERNLDGLLRAMRYREGQLEKYYPARFHLFLGVLAPPCGAVALWWVAQGFRQPRQPSS